ncbi:hypothetical protein M409DRAFT_67488 [Zasmidium cellare ATCC 36951]|uniref:F-box domain-containing protein n=1 Tax=Zasmidium cellare ATCC 36951 TaxID=1080233 RepID=A0A6A6CG99_ZASCE|nr:uncharacterized protein M409DRAFT_67488 [Zasmidium cellare ATCC 36951]KAF2165240.1 hypothetical protein M409DRAFT_67488 [Zasmidium cellare ATCC 36951]
MNQAPTNALREIPRFVQYTSAAPNSAPQDLAPRATTLPLNLIALIVSYLDDIGDIARVTRTSRLLYYMTLPQLYERVALHSYGEMRYVNGKPEGFGSGSPFMMALDGLVTKAHGSLVKHFRVWGQWRELGIDDFGKGRVPDNSMMLNTLLRAAMDKMSKLESFCWELDCKPLKTLYLGLGAHNNLVSFTLRFPSTRIPRPSVLIPPMANLRVFKAMDIDPMCYPDDISMLMLHSKKLVDVRLHFSPRMRQEAESIMNLNMFFGRCHKAGYKLKVKHFALQNFFGPNVLGMEQIFDVDHCTSITFLDTFGGNDPRTIFVDDTWKNVPLDLYANFHSVRCNELAPQHIEIMKNAAGKMRALYVVNERRGKTGYTPPDAAAPSPLTPNGDSHMDADAAALGPEYLYTITRYHGDTLKHLLLSDHWWLSNDDVVDIVRYCPNLEQLGLAINTPDHNILRLMMPFLPNLQVVRVLHNEHLTQHLRMVSHEERMWEMGNEAAQRPHQNMKMIGLGEHFYKVGKLVELLRENGAVERRREMSMVGKEEAMKYEIWRLDCLDISVDPIAKWDP